MLIWKCKKWTRADPWITSNRHVFKEVRAYFESNTRVFWKILPSPHLVPYFAVFHVFLKIFKYDVFTSDFLTYLPTMLLITLLNIIYRLGVGG